MVYAATGTINTSDARDKTEVKAFTDSEIEASKELSKEIGTYKWLESVKGKGDKTRTHIGFTVQKAIEIMEKHKLDPFAYGIICHDKWDDIVKPAWTEKKAITETVETDETSIEEIDGKMVQVKKIVKKEVPKMKKVKVYDEKGKLLKESGKQVYTEVQEYELGS